MRSTEDFFRAQIEECLAMAKWSLNKEDREFWKQLAQRWEERLRQLLRPPEPKTLDERAGTGTFRRKAS